VHELERMPGHLVRRLHQIATALFAEECGAFELTPIQYAALVVIRGIEGLDATRVSALISLDRATVGDVLFRMEKKGWLERYASPEDRRVKLLRLTEAGAEVLAQAGDPVLRVQERLLEPLALESRATFLHLLSQLTEGHAERELK
jgi:DNA-binding MarR family transcriptional regulator